MAGEGRTYAGSYFSDDLGEMRHYLHWDDYHQAFIYGERGSRARLMRPEH